MLKKTIFIVLIALPIVMQAQLKKASDTVLSTQINTVLFHKSGWDLSMPIIMDYEQLQLRFDYLGTDIPDLKYSIKYLDKNWKISPLNNFEYIEGYMDNYLPSPKHSFNTTFDYFHYALKIPNEDFRLLKSGNYIIQIYETDNEKETLLQKQFCINEDIVEIQAEFNFPTRYQQEIFITVDLNGLNVRIPAEEISLVVLRNYNWQDKLQIKRPPLIQGNKLLYNSPYQIIDNGINEYRYFDLKDTDQPTERISEINYNPPKFEFVLKKDEPRNTSAYFSSKDLNGRYYIDVPGSHNRHLEADYVDVEFKLASSFNFPGDVYIYGALTNWVTDKSNYMTYDAENQQFNKRLMLKQGFYNYAYVVKAYNSSELLWDYLEGNYSETENDYLIFVYYSAIDSDSDRLVGYKVISTKQGEE